LIGLLSCPHPQCFPSHLTFSPSSAPFYTCLERVVSICCEAEAFIRLTDPIWIDLSLLIYSCKFCKFSFTFRNAKVRQTPPALLLTFYLWTISIDRNVGPLTRDSLSVRTLRRFIPRPQPELSTVSSAALVLDYYMPFTLFIRSSMVILCTQALVFAILNHPVCIILSTPHQCLYLVHLFSLLHLSSHRSTSLSNLYKPTPTESVTRFSPSVHPDFSAIIVIVTTITVLRISTARNFTSQDGVLLLFPFDRGSLQPSPSSLYVGFSETLATSHAKVTSNVFIVPTSQ